MRYYGMGRRRQVRLVEKIPVGVSLYSPEKNETVGEPVELFTRDFSFLGLALEAESVPKAWSGKVEVGKTVFSVEFTLPGNESMTALANLIWLTRANNPKPGGKNLALGLRFSTLKEEDRRRIKDYVDASVRKMEKEAEKRMAK